MRAKIILLYGFSVEEEEEEGEDKTIDKTKNELIEPTTDDKIKYMLDDDIKMYNMPFYGDKNAKNLRYVGIKFGEVMSVFDNLHYSCDTLQITKLKPSKKIKKKMMKIFSDKKLQEQAIIQNVYTTECVCCNMYCGYFILTTNKYIEKNNPQIIDFVTENKNNLELIEPSHNITDNNYFFEEYKFIGKCLSNFTYFEFTDKEEPGNVFYNILRTKYKADYYDVTVKFKENTTHFEKMIVFIPEMCYCCT